MKHSIAAASILGFALLGGGTFAVLAQGLPGGASTLSETHGDWQVTCSTPEGAPRCIISQTHVSGENRRRVMSVELAAAEGGAAANGVLVLPFGLKLDNGVTLAIDEEAPLPGLRFSTCLPAGCLVPLAFDAGTVTSLKDGTALGVRAVANETGQEIAFSISLNGFTSALSRAAQLTQET